MNLLLPKAEPVSGSGGTPVIACLRKGAKTCAAAVREMSKENVNETALQVSESGMKFSLGKRSVREVGVRVFFFISHYPNLLLIGNK